MYYWLLIKVSLAKHEKKILPDITLRKLQLLQRMFPEKENSASVNCLSTNLGKGPPCNLDWNVSRKTEWKANFYSASGNHTYKVLGPECEV